MGQTWTPGLQTKEWWCVYNVIVSIDKPMSMNKA